MNLKKIFLAAICGGALAAGAFADNHPYGIDIAAGIVGVEDTEFKSDGVKVTYNEVTIFPIKVNTYCCPWLNNHLGIYGSIGMAPGVRFNYKVGDVKSDDGWFDFGVELMVGPAFGVDLGSSSIRFQVGAPFHVMGGIATREINSSKQTLKYSAFGFALTPQFRFMANRRCSLVVGADFVFDFALNMTSEKEIGGNTVSASLSPKDVFRFACTPYLGLGINFGD